MYIMLIFLNIIIKTLSQYDNACINAQSFCSTSEIGNNIFEGFQSLSVSHHLVPYLETCIFIRLDYLTTQITCEKGCSVHATCLAYQYSDACGLCVAEDIINDVQLYDSVFLSQSEIYIGLSRFVEYVAGEIIVCVTVLEFCVSNNS